MPTVTSMEHENFVFNAARDGKMHCLRFFLDHKPKEVVEALVSQCVNGTTPLVMAARNGHLEVVQYLILNCHADIEQVGSVTFDGETIEAATPLWCAAAAGHLNIVKCLVDFGASVNITTKTNSTPLRAACYDGHSAIAKYLINHGADIEIANKHGHTCLMITCYKGHFDIAKYLLKYGADVNRKSIKGNTALHDCAESGSLDILEMLLCHGAKMEVDSCGTTPLLSAAVTGHAPIVEYLISLSTCKKMEKINALELLGATYMDKKRDVMAALDYWRRAMMMRYGDPSFPLEKPKVQSPIAEYVRTTEVRTFPELEDLVWDQDEMRMQALLVRERILGPCHPDTSYYIRCRGATYADIGNFDLCIQLWMYALDVQQKVMEPLSPVIQSSLLSFAELFSFMMSESWARARGTSVSFRDVLHVFHRAIQEVEVAVTFQLTQKEICDSSQVHRTLIIVMHLIGLMCKLQPTLSKEEDYGLKCSVYRFIRMNPRGRNGWTPLHLACFKESSSMGQYSVCTFPSPEVVELLLEVGACPNTVDYDKNTPLHMAAMNKPCANAVFKTLLSRGAHLDLCNLDQKTPMQLAEKNSLDIYPLQFINLQCLSAQVIRRNNIQYVGSIPKKLETFIEAH